MQHGAAAAAAAAAHSGPGTHVSSSSASSSSSSSVSYNHMMPQAHITGGQVASQAVSTTTAQIQEAHSTTSPLVTGQTVTPAQLQEAEALLENDKKAIYRHPLFPLMALLFEKCEQATQTPDCPSSDSFDVDIQAFVHHQEQDRKPFFSDDPELDSLMVKAIQVLRIHLLELEKVNDLCKDFCNRYISCLKGKLQSENLLRSDMPALEGCTSPPLTSPQPTTPQPATMTALGQGQIVSGGTLYQMVQTPQGLVAQPIQQIQSNNNNSSSPALGGQQSGTVIHGSTPLSQIGVPTTPVSTQTSAGQLSTSPMVLSAGDLSDDDDYFGKKKNKRGVLPKQATQVMKSWLFQHIVHPYPTEDEKRQIANQTNLSLLQVNNWFINARRRILQPMLDASNPNEAKVKKAKTNNRPVQRFWPDNLANLGPTRPDAPTTPTSDSSTTPTDTHTGSGHASPHSQHAGDTPTGTPQPGLNQPLNIMSEEVLLPVPPPAHQMVSHVRGFHNGDPHDDSGGDEALTMETNSDDSNLE